MDPVWATTWAAIYHQVIKSIPYRYSSLSLDNIRLFRLIPDKNKAAIIKCELINYSLEPDESTHLYEALSYVWGNPNEIVPIFIDGHIFSVTKNLYAALLRLRDRNITRTVWVDAICIDQGNQDEKEHQIQSMAKIYGHANRAVVWLGEAADDSDLALEAIRVTGDKKSTKSFDGRIQHAVLALLQRPWFRRIWILQEVAAARNVLITCGTKKIDGYVFCLGVDSLKDSYEAYPDLQGLIRSVTYLIREAIFRSDYLAGGSGRLSLDICSLGELMDMYHTHEATRRHDKVYALLGMSSDDLSKAGLLPDYEVPWGELLQRLAKYLLPEKVSVETWDDKEIAIIKSKGRILGMVTSVQSGMAQNDRQNVYVTFKNIPGQPGEWSGQWTLQVSAKPIRDGDIICLLQGASKPMIVRLCRDHFAIIMITTTPPEGIQLKGRHFKWPTLSQSESILNRDLLLVWDWTNSTDKLQDKERYETLIRTNKLVSEYPKADLDQYLENATRTWNVALVLEDFGQYKEAAKKFQEAVKGYEIAFGKVCSNKLGSHFYGKTPLVWAAENGYHEIVKALLTKDGINPDLKDNQYGQTPLSWAAKGEHEAVVKQLLETGKVNVDSKDSIGRTPLSWAARMGHKAVVELLLDTDKADVNSNDSYGSTPLSWAARMGNKAVVELLLDTDKVDVNSKDSFERTPLSWAAGGGYEAVVKLLLETGKADVDSKDSKGWTPLSWAARKRHDAVVKLLRSHPNLS